MKASKSISLRRTFTSIQGVVGLLLVFLIVQGIILWRVCHQGTRVTQGLVSEGLPSLRHLAALQENLALYRLRSYELMFVEEKERGAKAEQADQLDKQNRTILAQLKNLFPEGEGNTQVKGMENALTNYVQTAIRTRGLLEKDFPGAMQILDKEIPPLIQRLSETNLKLKKFCDTFAVERADQTVIKFASIQKSVLGFGSASIAFAALAVVLVSLSSIRLQGMLSNLVGKLSSTMEKLDGSAGQIASASQSLAEGASEQAASLEETSASLEEISSMTKRNAENAENAKLLASRTRTAADSGSSDMQEMSKAMAEIKSSSDDIGKIIKTIDEIAFQTNILALNAAVEAARAGEAGMGFAVVADEVRNLAQRSAQAAKETASKIETAITKTEGGVRMSEKVAQSLSGMVVNVRKVDELVGEIATASKEQNEGISLVNGAVTKMDQVTQSNAASAEESAAAAAELNGQASNLKEVVEEMERLVGIGKAKAKEAPQPAAKSSEKSNVKSTPAGAHRTITSKGNSSRETAKAAHKPVLASNGSTAKGTPSDSDFRDF